MSSDRNRDLAAALWKIESPRLIAIVARMVKRVDLAEEIVQDAFVDALVRWEKSGPPDEPRAWLVTAAKHRALDVLRRTRTAERKEDAVVAATPNGVPADFEEAVDDFVGDDMLRLVFVACHPVLSREARVALTLRLVGGLTVEEIARAFFVPETTIGQRITRAKKTLADEKIPFELPNPEDLDARLESVLEVIYLIFNEGYAATTGADWMRPALCEDALRLGRVLAEIASREAEVHGLVALMELQASRLRARSGDDGEPILLPDQDRARWDELSIRRGLAALERAARAAEERPGPYLLQAAIAACHAQARTAAATDWPKIAALYDVLAATAPSPIVELNRAVAIGKALGAEEGLKIVEPLLDEPELNDYPFLASVHADLLAQVGRHREAKEEAERAAALTKNERERTQLLARAKTYAAKI
ncbi:MAG TPA: sigma-70 family RNA polymerase sigma factor [Polyangiaceae bacterium]